MAASAFCCNAWSEELRASNTTLPLPRTVFTSVKPAASNASFKADILAFIGITPRSNAAYRGMSKSSPPKRLVFELSWRAPMKYLCLIYQEEREEPNVPREQIEQAKKDYWAFAEGIKQSGNYVGSHGLQHTDQATTVRVRNGKLSTTDGPFAETKEQLGGYFLIEAKDRAEAIQIASRIPSAKWGSIEVRPVWGNGK